MIALSKLTGAGDTSSCQLFYQQLWLGSIKYALSAQCVMQKYAADRADGLTENIAFYWEVGAYWFPFTIIMSSCSSASAIQLMNRL